jgi:LysM repeat protein
VGHRIVGELKDQTRHASNLRKKQQKPTHQTHAPQMVASTKTKEYKVKDKDTLWAIAGKSMKNVQRIKELNGLKSDTIRPGQILKVPV